MDTDGRIRWIVLDEPQRARLREALADALAGRPAVLAAWHYGSSAQGSHPARDVDIGLLARHEERLAVHKEAPSVAAELAGALGWDAAVLDVRAINDGSPVFLHRMFRSAELLYEADRPARIRFEASAHSRWLDYRPVWERMRAAAFARWTDG